MKFFTKLKFATLAVALLFTMSCEEKEEVIPAPALSSKTTQATANAKFNTVDIQGVVDAGKNEITARGVVYNTTGSPTLADSKTTEAGNTFTSSINGLNPNTTYTFRVYATTAATTYYSEPIQVKTQSLAGTTWDFFFNHSATVTWHGDVTFNADGTTLYDEPSSPGTYMKRGTWSMKDNVLSYNMDSSVQNPTSYVFNGTMLNNAMSGTYTFGTANKPWSAVKR
ncbi:hypothetical protein GU926_03580 [Nibribacter ruber]|uniref:Fibronectin type-III domain-containing protein n=1 Tax=Nibribacter ruber TaxID=2698458 RepID=A0A6P1NXC5_9BACT|nr:hypothetical protein [Nibribacter ruber]QHL86568.1 hypothetical protein GU926_03580 [Nibribacter ruber]